MTEILSSVQEVEDLIKLVRTYRLTAGLAERLRLAEQIFVLSAQS